MEFDLALSPDERTPTRAVAIAQCRHGHRHINATAVLADVHRLVLHHGLAGQRELEQSLSLTGTLDRTSSAIEASTISSER